MLIYQRIKLIVFVVNSKKNIPNVTHKNHQHQTKKRFFMANLCIPLRIVGRLRRIRVEPYLAYWCLVGMIIDDPIPIHSLSIDDY